MIEVISGGLTVFTILMGVSVLIYWFASVKKAAKTKATLTGEQWLILGVFFGFVGQVLDNFYWLIAWSALYYDVHSSLTEFMFEHGTLANIPSRQVLGILAAYFHIRAALTLDDKTKIAFKLFVYFSLIASVSFSFILIFTR